MTKLDIYHVGEQLNQCFEEYRTNAKSLLGLLFGIRHFGGSFTILGVTSVTMLLV